MAYYRGEGQGRESERGWKREKEKGVTWGR